MSEIIAPNEIVVARETALTDTEKMINAFARRAATPADRVAFAELEQEMLTLRSKWEAAGLLPSAGAAAVSKAA